MPTDNVTSIGKYSYADPEAYERAILAEPESDHPLESEAMQQLHGKLLGWFSDERERQSVNRYQQALDCDFYDGLQWAEEDAQVLRERGQAPLVINQIKPMIDWVLGTEKRTRVDFKVLPREEDDVKGAEVKTKLLKYVDDVNRTPFNKSYAFADAVKAGVGWLEAGVSPDGENEPVYTRAESWRNVLYDSNSKARDLSDARYLFRWKWVDMDVACAAFPERADVLRQAAQATGSVEEEDELWYMGSRVTNSQDDWPSVGRRTYAGNVVHNSRERVKIIEAWYRQPCREQTPDETGRTISRFKMKMRVALMTEDHMILESESPYRHNRFPLVPVWCFRRDRDNAPYGAIRNVRDNQEDLNKRASKALHVLSTNQIVAEEGAVRDWEELRQEAARPDGIIIKKRGAELQMLQDKALAEEHLRLMELDSRMIREVSGVTGENMGRESNATSGRAILARQEQGSVVTAEIFDNYRYAAQLLGEIELSLIEQFYDMPKVVRLVGERGRLDWVPINAMQPDGSITNDITARQADFQIGEQDYRQSLRMAMFETMADMVSKLDPQIAINLIDLVVEMSDVPNKQEMAQRIRKINGQMDTSREPTPEEQQQIMAAQQQQAMAMQMQAQAAQLELAEKEAKIGKLQAEAQRLLAEVNAPPQGDGQADAQVEALRQQHEKKVIHLEKMLAQAQVMAENRRLQAEATVQAAKIAADNRMAVEQMKLQANAQQAERDAEREAQSAQAAEPPADLAAKIDALAEVVMALAEEEDMDETKQPAVPAPAPAPAPAAPTTINISVDAKTGEVKKSVQIERDAEGNMTGAKIVEGQ